MEQKNSLAKIQQDFAVAEKFYSASKDQILMAKSYDLYKKIAEQNENIDLKAASLYRLGRMHTTGEVAEINPKIALDYFNQIEKLNCPEAQVKAVWRIAELLLISPDLQNPQNYKKAFTYFSTVSHNAIDPFARANACFRLGYMHKAGLGTPADPQLAYSYYKYAAQQTDNIETQVEAKKELEILEDHDH